MIIINIITIIIIIIIVILKKHPNVVCSISFTASSRA